MRKSLAKWGRWDDCFTSDLGSGGAHFAGVPISLLHRYRARERAMNYNGRGDIDVSSALARANAALGAIINVTRTYVRIFIRCPSATRRKGELYFVAQ